MPSVSATQFDALTDVVALLLHERGFSPSAAQRDSAFGSHFSEFARGRERYRVVWDGKESWLVAEHCANSGGGGLLPQWKDVFLSRVERGSSPGDVELLQVPLREAIASHVAKGAV